MSKKLTLTLDKEIIESAKKYAEKKNISLSKLVEFYFKSLTKDTRSPLNNIPPITKELSGIARFKQTKSDKELLTDALNKKFL